MNAQEIRLIEQLRGVGKNDAEISAMLGLEEHVVRDVSREKREQKEQNVQNNSLQAAPSVGVASPAFVSPSEVVGRGSDSEAADISDAEYKRLFNHYKLLALHSNNDNVRERALKFLINEKKGRNDLLAGALSGKPNVVVIEQFNLMLQTARAVKERVLGPRNKPLEIAVESEKVLV